MRAVCEIMAGLVSGRLLAPRGENRALFEAASRTLDGEILRGP